MPNLGGQHELIDFTQDVTCAGTILN
jgi:hypothetical protein